MSSLPERPSALIRTALDDLREVEASEGYRVEMGIWHSRTFKGDPCMVCLAGAVMAKSLGLGTGTELHSSGPNDFPKERHKLMALEWFRLGNISLGVREMSLPREPNQPHERHVVKIPIYSQNPEGFHAALRSMADELEKEGL